MAEEELTTHVKAVTEQLPASDKKLNEIRTATKEDELLQGVIETMKMGWPNHRKDCSDTAKSYWEYRSDLTVIDGILICGDRIVIPKKLRPEMLKRIHEGHLGMSKCKWRARQSICWPGMGKQIEEVVRKCETCARMLISKPKEPMLSYDVPTRPWEMLGTDLFEFGGKKYLIIVDYYSLWPEVYLLSETKSKNVIEAIKQTLSQFGIPNSVYSDNGTQYTAKEFKNFITSYKIQQKNSSPHYPQSNGLAESMVKTTKRLIKKCQESNEDLPKGLLCNVLTCVCVAMDTHTMVT